MLTLPGGVTLMQIPSAPNADYMAGSDGKVYSRTKYKGFGRKDYVDWYPLAGHTTTKGYVSISMSHENKKVTRLAHRLICEAFTAHHRHQRIRCGIWTGIVKTMFQRT